LLSGGFTFAGLGDVRVGPDYIDWGESGNVFGPTDGDIFFLGGTGDFSTLAVTEGTIKDLDAATEPAGTPISVASFFTAAAEPTWVFTLTFIPLGAGSFAGCTSTPGDVCTFPGSPFTITNLSSSESAVALTLRGTVSDGSGDPPSSFTAQLTTQKNMSAAQILAALSVPGGFVQSSFSGEVQVAAIPEPAQASLIGLALIAVGMIRYRFVKRVR
jgi:hypothetical protein